MSIDFSRAFDNVPRWALQMALSKAGASNDMQQPCMKSAGVKSGIKVMRERLQ